jgi:hypothetical protein
MSQVGGRARPRVSYRTGPSEDLRKGRPSPPTSKKQHLILRKRGEALFLSYPAGHGRMSRTAAPSNLAKPVSRPVDGEDIKSIPVCYRHK